MHRLRTSLSALVATSKAALTRAFVVGRAGVAAAGLGLIELFTSVRGRRVLAVLALGGVGAVLAWRPPLRTVDPGSLGVRVNRVSGSVSTLSEGPALVLPFLHELRSYPLRDQIYRPARSAKAEDAGAFQSIEGLSIGAEVTIRYALDPERVVQLARRLPAGDLGPALIEPIADGVLHRTFAKRSVREIFADKRADVQREIEETLRAELRADGVLLRALFIGHVDLPAQYKAGLEGLLAEELATAKMKYTLELKEKKVKETALEAQAAKVQRETAAEAAGQEEIIAAKSRAEAMKHVLPLKEKEIEQHRLEAEARKVMRMKDAEGNAEARRIEAAGESDGRRKLAEAEAFRLDAIGRATSEQMAREGALISRNPLLIQKTLVDKLSDKIQVVIAPPTSGGFFAQALLGGPAAHRRGKGDASDNGEAHEAEATDEPTHASATAQAEGGR